jgi:hypothetical protein
MVAYLDSSLALRYILKGDPSIRHALACERVISSELFEIECRRVIHRCRMEGELDDDGVATAISRLEKIISGISLLRLSDAVKKRAMDAFPVSVKTLDALHLASALLYAEKTPDDKVLLFSLDAGMSRCARILGLAAPLG